jgi:hypothetical protein
MCGRFCSRAAQAPLEKPTYILLVCSCNGYICLMFMLCRWNSAELGDVWPVSQGQLKQQAGIDGKALNVEQSLDDLKVALGVVVAVSAISAVASGVIGE